MPYPPIPVVAGQTCQNPCTPFDIHWEQPGDNCQPLKWKGWGPKPVITDPSSGLTTIFWDLTEQRDSCCPIVGVTYTTGAQNYIVPANKLITGSYTFPIALADGAIITAVFTYGGNCATAPLTLPAFISYTSNLCLRGGEDLPPLQALWILLACGLEPCDCNVPFPILIDGETVGMFDKAGKLVVTDPAWKTKLIGELEAFCGDSGCKPTTRIYLGFTPGVPAGTLIQALIGTPGQLFNFVANGCEDNNPIAGVCTPGGGGGANLTFSATFPLIESQIGNNINYAIDPSLLQEVSDNTTNITNLTIRVDNDVNYQQSYLIGDWVIDGFEMRLDVIHNQGNPIGTDVIYHCEVTATGAVYTVTRDVDSPNMLQLFVPLGAQDAITVVVEDPNV